MGTPVFDGAREGDVTLELQKAGLDADGQSVLLDGRTGEAFARKVTVGHLYKDQLHPPVHAKIHAR